MPKQFPSKELAETVGAIGDSVGKILLAQIIGLIVLQFILSKVIKLMWILFFILQFLTAFLYFNVSQPANLQLVIEKIKGTLELDAIPKDDIKNAISENESFKDNLK